MQVNGPKTDVASRGDGPSVVVKFSELEILADFCKNPAWPRFGLGGWLGFGLFLQSCCGCSSYTAGALDMVIAMLEPSADMWRFV